MATTALKAPLSNVRRLVWRFALAGAAIGLSIGLVEAGLFYWIPRATGLVRPDTRYVIWFLAPVVDLTCGALASVIAGRAAGALSSQRRGGRAAVAFFAALGLGFAGAYLARLLTWFRIGTGVMFPERLETRTPVEWFLIVFLVAFVSLMTFARGARPARPIPRRSRGWLILFAGVYTVSIAGIAFYAIHGPLGGFARASRATHGAPPARPNVVLIVLDTVRADHLTCYGYARPTTPNLDRVAARGVLFENAVAPSSWTLPSIVSVLTGLMPHQSGADWGRAPGRAPWTLARILGSKGYDTAGFNANPFYGLGGWRLSQGFNVYDDDASSIRHNLAVTFVGQSVLRWLYNRLVRYNQFDRRDAEELNRDIERWMRRRDPSKPYFLFINYMDAHRPYLPPAPFDRRFGRLPSRLLSRLTEPLDDGRPRKPYTSRDRAELIDGYDNSLAYLDVEVGRLIDFIERGARGGNTVFIITSDHGEGFGEHGAYDHGWNLYDDVLRVPLIIAGPGVPSGARVTAVVPNRGIFSTVLDLALRLKGVIALSTLRNDWQPGLNENMTPGGVVSELNLFSRGADPALLSLTTPEWHLIVNSGGRAELYHWPADPREKRNLADDPLQRDALMKLESALEARVAYSLLPWRALDYLSPLNGPGKPFIEKISQRNLKLPAAGIPLGSAQAVFSGQPPSQLVHPPPSEEDLLRTLPYH